jgi:aspartate/methionine/tyrosine aminotransferase
MTLPPLLARLLIRTGFVRLLPGLQRRLEGGVEYLRYYSDRLLGSPLDQLGRLAGHLGQDAPDVIDLASAAPRFDLGSSTTRLPADGRGWPDPAGMPELRGAVAAKLLADNRLAVSPAEEVLITHGALGAAHVILDAFVNRGDRVVLLDPASPIYPLLARTRGASIWRVGTRLDGGRLRLRFDHLSRALHGARLLVIESPANPTGGGVAAEDLEQVAWWADRHDVLVLADEVFERFRYDGEAGSFATLPLARARTLTVGSVSKGHALTSARVGWIAAHRHLLRPCAMTAGLRSPFVSAPAQLQALAALRTPPSAFEPVLARMDSRRRYAHERLQAAGFDAELPAGGCFFWLRVPARWESGAAFAEALHGLHRVRVLPGDLFGPSGKRHVRLSYAADEGRLEEGLNRLAKLVRGQRPERGLRLAA